ncbi:MAG: glycosyltransferase [Succinivibrio sp.]
MNALDLYSKYKLWRFNGSSRLECSVNIIALALLWAFLPLENQLFEKVRNNFYYYYPQIKPNRPRLFDPVRFIIQTLFLMIVRQSNSTKKEYVSFFSELMQFLHKNVFIRVVAFVSKLTNKIKGDSSEKHELILSSKHHNLLKFLLILSFFAAVIAVTQPFDVTYQFVFVGLMWCLAILLRSAQNRVSLMLMIFISIIISTRYIYWRITKTVILVDFVTASCAILLLLAELYAYIVLLLSYFQVSWVLNRKPYPLPEDQSLWPSVDVFIPSYNEPLEVVKPTLLAALDIDWPEDKLNVYMLDDGSRPEFERYCREIGIGYITRTEHNHAKAGNINHALTKTSGDLVAIFDCDHIPVRAFLQMTVGWMVHDENIALVQTPHHFYSDDPFEKNLSLKGNVPAENSLFHDFIQKGNDTWNATMFCGSCAVIRRKPLEEIGGIAVRR